MSFTGADERAIHRLYASYAHAMDEMDLDALRACFSADGTLTIPASGVRAEGREGVVRFAQGYHKATGGRNRHLVMNVLVTESPDQPGVATGAAYLVVVTGGSGERPPTLVTTGVYRDRLVSEGTTWRFAARELLTD